MRKKRAVSHAAVCVIVAAYNAQETIARAIRSALQAPETAELVVVDDASSDASADAARAANDGTGRLRILRLDTNSGPAAARNIAIANSSAPVLATLDADDFFLPGRLARLLALPGWDAIADDMLFVPESLVEELAEDRTPPCDAHADKVPERIASRMPPSHAASDEAPHPLDLPTFIEGNIARPGRPRGELGFLKPLIRRDFLERHGLAFDESLRLGEDFILYAQMLKAGARFLLSPSCGYCAIERPGSLSGRHRTDDLAALLAADEALLDRMEGPARTALLRHRHALAVRTHHRRTLDAKRERGLLAGLGCLMHRPALVADVTRAVLRDKLGLARPRPAPTIRRLLG